MTYKRFGEPAGSHNTCLVSGQEFQNYLELIEDSENERKDSGSLTTYPTSVQYRTDPETGESDQPSTEPTEGPVLSAPVCRLTAYMGKKERIPLDVCVDSGATLLMLSSDST